VVSDAGPLIHLAQIRKLHLLKKLFGCVSIVIEVEREAVDEGIRLGHADAQLIMKAVQEGWVVVEDLPKPAVSAVRKLAKDENLSEADARTLILAKQTQAQIIVDEKILSDLARMFGLQMWNTWTILFESLRKEYIRFGDIENAIAELGEKRHKLTAEQAAEILKTASLIKPQK
jgi:predicted nucleic acid-binding protein